MLIGGAIGVVGLIASDGVGVFKYIFSSQNLLKENVMISGDAALYLNTCFNCTILFFIFKLSGRKFS